MYMYIIFLLLALPENWCICFGIEVTSRKVVKLFFVFELVCWKLAKLFSDLANSRQNTVLIRLLICSKVWEMIFCFSQHAKKCWTWSRVVVDQTCVKMVKIFANVLKLAKQVCDRVLKNCELILCLSFDGNVSCNWFAHLMNSRNG